MDSIRSGSRAAACMTIRPGMAAIMPWMQLKDANSSAISSRNDAVREKCIDAQSSRNARNQRGKGEVFGQPIIANIPGNKDHGLDTQDGARGPVFEAVSAECDSRNMARLLGPGGTKSDLSSAGMCDHA